MKSLFVALILSASCFVVQADSSRPVHHLVIVWLKQAGDEAQRQQYIQASKAFAELPGVLSYEVGTPASIKRSRVNAALDESYDVAVASRFESEEAFEAFLKNPDYQKVAQEVLKPLVDRYKIYEFVE